MRKAKAQPEKTVDTILQAGQIVDGKYRVDRLLGQGGMAAVWAGTNERTGKRVALKVILKSLVTTREAQQLLHAEALAASRVNHPNVVSVFDVIEHEGMTCIVMELLDGEPLGSYIARHGYLSVGEATGILLPAMRGVAAAHAQGVIHRDLKPQNIFVCIGPDGRIVTSKVLDFGISVMVERVMDPPAGEAPGLALGTPAYMSPEHLSGVAPIDQRADVYGFGVLLYEALTGQMAFPGDQGPALFDRILNQPAPPVTLYRPDLPPGLVRIIEKAMAKQPDQRYSGMNSMVGAFEDEVAPATPAPRLLTPIAGVPSVALRDPLSAPHPGLAVPAIVKQELSGQHQETQMLFGFPLEKESKESASDREKKLLFGFPVEKESKESVPDGGDDGGSNEAPQEESVPDGWASGAANDGSEEAAPPPPTGRSTIRLRGRLFSRETPYRPEMLSPLRGWRGVVGGGAAVLLVLVVWMAMRDARPARKPAPVTGAPAPVAVTPAPVPVAPAPVAVAPEPVPVAPEPVPVAPPPVPVANPTPQASESPAPPAVPPVVEATAVAPAADPGAASSSPPAPSSLATVKSHKFTRYARDVPAPVTSSRSSVAVREASKDASLRRQARAALKLYEAEWVPSSAPPRAGALAKPEPPSAPPKASALAKPEPPSSAPRAVTSAKPPAPRANALAKPAPPRAGTLSADDF